VRLFPLLAAALFVVPAACAPQGEETTVLEAKAGQSTPGGHLAGHDLRLTTAHQGIRRLEFAPRAGAGFSFREEITTDGKGNYSLRPLDSESATLDWATFELMQTLREGFLFRYRDLVVRNERLLARNWEVIDLGHTIEIAGRSCRALRVERLKGERIVFELAVDRETRLLLANRRYDAQGNLVSSMEYETFRLEPDTTGTAWHVPANEEQPLPLRDLGPTLGQRILEPRLLPEGFALHEAATVVDGEGERWLKLTYVDGIDTLFFLQKLEQPAGPGAVGRRPGTSFDAPPPETSQVTVHQVEHITVAQGQVEGFSLIALGPVSETELLDLIESSLP
jgi:hypothetical protein